MSKGYPAPPQSGTNALTSITGVVSWQTSVAGVTAHTALTALGWTASGHTGTAVDGTLAGFNGTGAAAEFVIGTDVQAHHVHLDDISGLSTVDSYFMVANGTTWVAESPSTARTSMGLGSLATASTINNGNWSGTDLAVANGGTGASTASAAATNLGLGTASAVTFSSLTLSSHLLMGVNDQMRMGGTSAYISGDNSFINYSCGTGDDHLFKVSGTTYWSFDGGTKRLNLNHTGNTGIDMLTNTALTWGGTSPKIEASAGTSMTVTAVTTIGLSAPTIQLDSNAILTWTGGTQIYETSGIDLWIEADDDLLLRPDDDLWIYVGTTAWAYFDGGNKRFGVNKSVPLYALDVIPATAVTYGGRISSWGANSYSCLALITAGDSTPDSGDTFIAFQGSTGTIVGSVKGNGTGVTYNTTSDARLKFNVAPMPTMSGVVASIDFVVHEWKSDPGRVCYGTIAQQLEEVYPQAVLNPAEANLGRRLVWYSKLKSGANKDGTRKTRERGVKHYDRVLMPLEAVTELRAEEGVTVHEVRHITRDDPEFQWYQVDYSQLVVPIGKALQEQIEENQALRARLTALEELVATLIQG